MMIYDLAIIGGGPAGYSAALEATKYGLSVLLFEKELLGGTCLNKGCVPTKFLAHVAELYDSKKDLEKYGINTTDFSIDFNKARSEMNRTVGQLRDGLEQLLIKSGVKIIYGEASVVKTGLLRCENEEYKAKDILIATGSTQATSIIDGTISSDDLLKYDTIPKTVLVIGGGVVAVEFSYILNKLGSQVTIAIRGERILRKWDKELAISISQHLKKSGITIMSKCTKEDYLTKDYELVLSAVGRVPARRGTELLELDTDENNAIVINKFGRTNIDNIYAAGDVISDSPMLAHTAMEQGRNIVKAIVGEKTHSSVVASCIYISPEIATVGMTEAEARNTGVEVVSGKINMASNARTKISTTERSFIKVVADKRTHEILGAQLMCERASDIASEFLVVIENRITVEKLKESVHPHPSFSEAIMDVLDVLIRKFDEV